MAVRKARTASGDPALRVYRRLMARFGPQGWWPARTRLEMMVGAILTQHTAWSNVERAMTRLRREGAIDLRVLRTVDPGRLAEWIRPAGYYRLKARHLRAFADFCGETFHGDLRRMFRQPTGPLRDLLLQVNGIGPETADSMLLYAGRRPVFVVDAYTRRVLARHAWMDARAGYDAFAAWFMDRLPRDTALFNEYHALLVRLGKEYCRTRPRCAGCPLRAEGGPEIP